MEPWSKARKWVMMRERHRKPGLLFTKPDKLQLFDQGYIVAQELDMHIQQVMAAAAYETEFIEEMDLAKAFAKNNAEKMVFVKLTMTPRHGTCAAVKSHLEWLS